MAHASEPLSSRHPLPPLAHPPPALIPQHAWVGWLAWAAVQAIAGMFADPMWIRVGCGFGSLALAFVAGAELAFSWNAARAERLSRIAGESGHAEVIRITALRGQCAAVDQLADAAERWEAKASTEGLS